MEFVVRHTSSDNLVRTKLEQFGVFPIVEFHLGEEPIFFGLRPSGRNTPRGEVVDDMNIPRGLLTIKSCSSGNESFKGKVAQVFST